MLCIPKHRTNISLTMASEAGNGVVAIGCPIFVASSSTKLGYVV